MKFKTVFIWYATPFVLAIAWVAAFYIPMSSRIGAQERELKTVKQESERIDTQAAATIEMKKRSEQAKTTFEEFQAQLPVVEELPGFVRAVAASAKKDGVTVVGFNNILASVDTEEKLPLVTSVFEIDLRGRFWEIGRFVEDLGSKRAFKDVLIAKIGYNEKEYPMLTGKVVVGLRAWKGKIGVEGK